jgi:beta-galactosidase
LRVATTIVDPSGKPVGKVATAPASAPEGGEQTYEQTMVVRRPLRWSLEQRNLFKLLTKVSARGEMVDRHETPFGFRW